MRRYVLITPAKNEEAMIGHTLRSVVAQTVLPEKWVIVSDGSVDRTEEIVQDYCRRHAFIELVRIEAGGNRNFGSKVNAFHAGYGRVQALAHDFVGNLDADVSFARDYFEALLEKMERDPKLGIAGGIIQERIGNRYVGQSISRNSVAGAVQLFRRPCYEQIGGYLPLQFGGVDAAAEIQARMHGWSVQTFLDLKVLHHRRVASATGSILRARLRQGRMDYLLGYHPLFQSVRCVYRMKENPVFLGSMLMLWGYFSLYLRRRPMQVPERAVAYLRAEQIHRLRRMLVPGGK